jgi:PAS domain S-box-containing protein
MLVVIGLFVFYKMPFLSIVIIGLIQIIAFSSANYLNGNYTDRPFYYYNNLFFVISIYSIGFMMAYMFRQLNWRNFTHQQALSDNNRKLMEEIRERKLAVDAYQQSELQYHNTLDSIPDWIYVIDRENRFIMMNSSLREVHQQNGFPTDVIGRKIDEIYPFITAATLTEFRHVFEEGVIYVAEQKMEISGVWHYMETRKVPIFRDNKVYQVMTILRDRSKEKEVEELKQRNAEQKEIMLREIHHRVKNNLAIVISLLSLQLRNNDDPILLRIIRDIEMRIRSMALIHEHLYRSENIDRIPLASYLHALATIITGTFSGHRIRLITELEPVDVSIETALPIGLIANELLTNAFKYAFPAHGEGEIVIGLETCGPDAHILTIRDNGIGLPDHFSLDSEKSLGMFIVRLLVEQLDGQIAINRNHGTEFKITFKNIVVRKQELDEKPV